jgi:hypothetical protein
MSDQVETRTPKRPRAPHSRCIPSPLWDQVYPNSCPDDDTEMSRATVTSSLVARTPMGQCRSCPRFLLSVWHGRSVSLAWRLGGTMTAIDRDAPKDANLFRSGSQTFRPSRGFVGLNVRNRTHAYIGSRKRGNIGGLFLRRTLSRVSMYGAMPRSINHCRNSPFP